MFSIPKDQPRISWSVFFIFVLMALQYIDMAYVFIRIINKLSISDMISWYDISLTTLTTNVHEITFKTTRPHKIPDMSQDNMIYYHKKSRSLKKTYHWCELKWDQVRRTSKNTQNLRSLVKSVVKSLTCWFHNWSTLNNQSLSHVCQSLNDLIISINVQ